MSTLWNDLAPIAIVNGSDAIANASANVAGYPRSDGMNTAQGDFFGLALAKKPRRSQARGSLVSRPLS